MFSTGQLPALRSATSDLSWLLDRGYAIPSSLKLVGDRHALNARQRQAVARCACTREQLATRREGRAKPDSLAGRALLIDGYNVLTSIEAALAGGVILHGRDGAYRDMASMHGSYRTVEETLPALELLGEALARWRVAEAHWYFDEPVSNSGRLAAILRALAAERHWPWTVELVPDPDVILARSSEIVASADSEILDRARAWFPLARSVIYESIPEAWMVELPGRENHD